MHKLSLPRITERIYVFTPPVNEVMHVADHDEVYRLSLNNVPSVEVTNEHPYDFAELCGVHFGAVGAPPLLSVNGISIAYKFDPKADIQYVKLISNSGMHNIEFPTFSGDWFVATLTNDAAYLLIAEPYLLEVYALK